RRGRPGLGLLVCGLAGEPLGAADPARPRAGAQRTGLPAGRPGPGVHVERARGGLGALLRGTPRRALRLTTLPQTELARAAGMTQSAVARFEAGGTVPTLPVLDRLAQALDADLTVTVTPRTGVA